MNVKWKKHIISDKSVALGKPTIRGTRITVSFIIDLFAAGWTEEEILDNYPRLTKEDLQAVFAYVQECMSDSLLYDLDNKPV